MSADTSAADLGREVTLRLSYAEIVVLFELLGRWDSERLFDRLSFEHNAELRVLWDLSASLEPLVAEAFRANYQHVWQAACEFVSPTAD